MKERACKKSDIQMLTERIRYAQKMGNAGPQYLTDTVSDIRSAIDLVSQPEGQRKLQFIPIEELNARKAGIRINVLKDAGYVNMYDIWSASSEKLSSVYGIGEVMAQKAKEIANAVADEVCNSVKLKLSTDHKTPEYSKLVTSVAEYIRAKNYLPYCQRILAMLPPTTNDELASLNCASNGVKWLFASERKKNAANDAYAHLLAVADAIDATQILPTIQGPLIGSSESLNGKGQVQLGLQPISEFQAWDDFAKRPVEYYNVLESIEPDRFDSSEDGYGLSKEICEGVANTPVDLTGLACTLRGYQIWGVKYILHQKRVLLGDEMGLGKTIQALAAMVSVRNGCPKDEAPAQEEQTTPAQENVATQETAAAQEAAAASAADPSQESLPQQVAVTHFVVVCPASVIVNWCREIEGKSDMKAYNMHDAQRASAFATWKDEGGVAVVNYESLENHFELEEDFPLDMVIVDEAHYIKNISAKRSQNVLKLCKHTDRIVFMTGTPLENRVDEMVGLLGHLQDDVAKEAKTVSVSAYADEFKRKISPVYYRRRRNDVLAELPELTDVKEWCDMTEQDAATYENDVVSGSLMDARRVSWRNEDFLNTSSKAQRLREIVEEASEDARKVLVFSFFLDTLEKVKALCGERCVGVINGSVPIEERQGIIDAFDAAPAGAVLAAQISSGGTGLNIQSASVVVLCEPQYKPSIENQAISRAHRMGQTRDVIVHRLLCPDTVDERMLELLEAKQAEFDTFADESSAAQRDLDLEENQQVDVTQGVIVGEMVKEGMAGAEVAAATGAASTSGETSANSVSTNAASEGADTSDSQTQQPEREISQASMNRIFEEERARILAQRQAQGAQAGQATQVMQEMQETPATQEESASREATATQMVAPSMPRANFCRHCGAKADPDAIFCSQCGERLYPEELNKN